MSYNLYEYLAMRLSRKETIALRLLVAHGGLYGLELVAAAGGELRRGTVYVTLQRMAAKGLVESRIEEPGAGEQGPARRVFEATGLGRRALVAQRALDRVFAGGS